jgi:hypothetical protein
VLIAVEMNSSLSIGELLATENDATEALKTIIRRLECESGQKLTRIRTDSSDMQLHEVVKDTCKINSIQYDLCPEPEQNSAAAHATAAYMHKVRYMLHTAKMDARYWGKAFMYAIHAQNLLPSTTNMGKVPVHTWTGHQYTQYTTTHLHQFRSTAYVDVIKWNGHGVLEATSVGCQMLGWWVDRLQGYRLEDPTTRTLSRHVTLNLLRQMCWTHSVLSKVSTSPQQVD